MKTVPALLDRSARHKAIVRERVIAAFLLSLSVAITNNLALFVTAVIAFVIVYRREQRKAKIERLAPARLS